MKNKKRKITELMILLHAIYIMVDLLVYQVLSSFYFSLTSKNLIKFDFDMVWLDNFKFVLTNPDFYRAFFNSIIWTVMSIAGQLIIGLTAALALNHLPKFGGIYRSLLIIPWTFP